VSGCPPPSHLCSPGRLVSPGLGGTPCAAALPVCPRVRCAGTEDGRRDLPISLVPGREGAARLGVQEERAVRDRNLLQVQDHDQPIPWKVQFHLGNSSRPGNQCRNSIQGKHLITDELGYICERKDLLVNGCCNVNVPGTKQYRCDGCLPNGCCSAYEYCVSCCLQPSKQLLLERFLNRAAVAFQNLFMAVEDHFELCLAKCRTSSQSVQHENTYRDPIAKYCYGESPPELFPA
uniref:SREBP regulating gene protein n=1 Tax=Felis catus TaxID=9685 RepID=A0ABI7YPK0_FELCA